VLELAVAQQRAELLAGAFPALADALALLLVDGGVITGRDALLHGAARADDEGADRRGARTRRAPGARSAAEVAGRLGHRREEQIQDALLRPLLRDLLDLGLALFADHVHGDVDEVAHHGLHVPPDVADFGELRGLDLDEGRAGELRETARDLRLTDAGRADHDDVVGHDLIAQVVLHLLAAPAVAERDGHGLLG